jgi:uncharacterized membrane protein YebE (DUF533 family)
MTNFGDLIGGLLQNAMASSGNQRIDSSIRDLQRTKFEVPATSGGAGDLFGNLRDMLQSGLGSAAASPAKAGGIGAILGSLLGGGGDSIKGAIGGGALALLASVAMKALTGSTQAGTQGVADLPDWSGGDAPLGLKVPETREQEQMLQKTAELVLRGMINAAKADGQISRDEVERIIGKLREAGLDDSSQQWLVAELQKPLDLRTFADDIPNREVAAQVYAASLLAIEVDTLAEQRYLQDLAQLTQLPPAVVQQIHQTMGARV